MYLPKECNRLPDCFAGQASAAAKEAAGNPLVPLHHAALPRYQLAQPLGFIVEQGTASHVPAFVLTECSAPAPQELHTRLHPHYKFISMDYIASAVASFHCLSEVISPQLTPLEADIMQWATPFFGNSHWEIDISGAHYELMRQCKTRIPKEKLSVPTQLKAVLSLW